MRRILPAALLAASSVLAHEGEAVEEHSALQVFWDASVAPNALYLTGGLLVVAAIVFFWWTGKHGVSE